MLHTHSRIWIHITWATKNRERVLFSPQGKPLFDFLINKSKEIGVPLENLNIQPEHVHALIDLPTHKSVANIMQYFKGSSARWLNKNIFKAHFSWQRGYGAYSVSSSQLEKVKKYIDNQEEHHQHVLFKDEYETWKKEYGIIDD